MKITICLWQNLCMRPQKFLHMALSKSPMLLFALLEMTSYKDTFMNYLSQSKYINNLLEDFLIPSEPYLLPNCKLNGAFVKWICASSWHKKKKKLWYIIAGVQTLLGFHCLVPELVDEWNLISSITVSLNQKSRIMHMLIKDCCKLTIISLSFHTQVPIADTPKC